MRAGLAATGPRAGFEAILRFQRVRLRAPAHGRVPELYVHVPRTARAGAVPGSALFFKFSQLASYKGTSMKQCATHRPQSCIANSRYTTN